MRLAAERGVPQEERKAVSGGLKDRDAGRGSSWTSCAAAALAPRPIGSASPSTRVRRPIHDFKRKTGARVIFRLARADAGDVRAAPEKLYRRRWRGATRAPCWSARHRRVRRLPLTRRSVPRRPPDGAGLRRFGSTQGRYHHTSTPPPRNAAMIDWLIEAFNGAKYPWFRGRTDPS